MRRDTLHQRVAELEKRFIGNYLIITTQSGRKVRISDKDAVGLMLEAWDAISRTYSLDAGELSRVGISDQLAAVADCSESNPDWPNALQHAHNAVTDCGKHVGLNAVMEFLRTKPDSRFLMKEEKR